MKLPCDNLVKEIKERVSKICEEATESDDMTLVFIKGQLAGLMSWVETQMETVIDEEVIRRQIKIEDIEEMKNEYRKNGHLDSV